MMYSLGARWGASTSARTVSMSPPIPRMHENDLPIRLQRTPHGSRCPTHASADKPTILFQLNVARFYILLLKYQHHDLVPCIRHFPRHFAKRSNGCCASYVCFAPPFLTSLNNQRFALHCAVYVVLCSTFLFTHHGNPIHIPSY